MNYLWNATNHTSSLASGTQWTQAVEAVHFNATLSYRLPKINGQPLSGSPEQLVRSVQERYGIRSKCSCTPMHFTSLAQSTGWKGNKLVVLRLQWLPNRKGSTKDDQ